MEQYTRVFGVVPFSAFLLFTFLLARAETAILYVSAARQVTGAVVWDGRMSGWIHYTELMFRYNYVSWAQLIHCCSRLLIANVFNRHVKQYCAFLQMSAPLAFCGGVGPGQSRRIEQVCRWSMRAVQWESGDTNILNWASIETDIFDLEVTKCLNK